METKKVLFFEKNTQKVNNRHLLITATESNEIAFYFSEISKPLILNKITSIALVRELKKQIGVLNRIELESEVKNG